VKDTDTNGVVDTGANLTTVSKIQAANFPRCQQYRWQVATGIYDIGNLIRIKEPGLSFHVKVKAGKQTTAGTAATGAASEQGDLPHSDPVLRIHDILVWIRIRMRGSMPLTNGSGSFSFHH
jgi:hypothetical protein